MPTLSEPAFWLEPMRARANEAYRNWRKKQCGIPPHHQRPDGSWYYGEQENMHWVDNFHTAYVLDCFKYYQKATDDDQFQADR